MEKSARDQKNLKEAEKLLKEGNLKESEVLYSTLTTSRCVGPTAKSGLGILYLRQDRVSEANELFRSVINAGHRVAEAYYGLGVISENSDPGYARAQYEFALGINPKHQGSLARLQKLKPAPARSAGAASTFPGNKFASINEERRDDGSPPISKKSPLNYTGIATNVRYRTEQRGIPPRTLQIIEFRLQRSQNLFTVPVYMAGWRVKGTISEGDKVVLKGRLPKARSPYETSRVFNDSAGSYVQMSGSNPTTILFVITALIILVGLGILILNAVAAS